MILYPQNTFLLMLCTVIVAGVEFLRILIAYLVSLPSTFKRRSLDKEKLQVQSELAAIKSVQLELVKASKLERNIIKIDKEISKLKDGQEGVDKRLKPILRGLRLVVLIGVAIYFGTETVVHISPQVIWPLALLSSEPSIGLQPWLVMGITSLASRHFFRTILPVLLPSATFP